MDEHPELEGYEPFAPKPLRSRRYRRGIQFAALLGVLLLLAPLVASQAHTASVSAQGWCRQWVSAEVREPSVPVARFEMFGPGVLGWECYATRTVDGDRYVGNLGIIPTAPKLPGAGTPV